MTTVYEALNDACNRHGFPAPRRGEPYTEALTKLLSLIYYLEESHEDLKELRKKIKGNRREVC